MLTFIDELFNRQSGTVVIEVPDINNHNAVPSEYTRKIRGILIDDPQIHFQNNFSTLSELHEALSTAQDTQQVFGANNLLNYIPASAMTWQGTPPITLHMQFYLISFNANSNIMQQARWLTELCTLKVTDETSSRIHGGYRYHFFDGSKFINNQTKTYNVQTAGGVPGTCTVKINNERTVINGLLLLSAQCQPSTVVCRNDEPLYYIVSVRFTGYRPPVTSDLDSIFAGTGEKK